MRKEIRITGYGGQGVILSAHIMGKAVTLFEDRYSTMTQSFGPEARGSSCSAQVVIADEPVGYPYVHQTDALIAMSQEGFEKHLPTLKDDGVLVVEQDLVDLGSYADRPNTFSVPATRIAEGLGRRIVLNIAMLGYVGAATDLVSAEALRKAVEDSVPAGTEQLNLQAFEGGYDWHTTKERSGSRRRNSGDTVGT